jgi:predicted dithiol-disulfide oxidoreductase (DUF899 family)
MLCISRGPLSALQAYKQRMGWTFEWASSAESEFNFDLGVSYHMTELDPEARHNFTQPPGAEGHAGLSSFALLNGEVYHAYSCYSRGLEAFNAGYALLDRAPRGRNEDCPE